MTLRGTSFAGLFLTLACLRCGSAFTNEQSGPDPGATGAGGANAAGSLGAGGSSTGDGGSTGGSAIGSTGGASGQTGAGGGTGGTAGGGMVDAGMGGAGGARDAAADVAPGPSPCSPTPPLPLDPCTKEGLVCSYGLIPRPSCRTIRKCDKGHWITDTSFGECPNVAADCPDAPPDPTSLLTCNHDQVGRTCDFATGPNCTCSDTICAGACMIVNPPRFVCSTPPPKPCPATIPNAGSGCAPVLSCDYPGASCGIIAKCAPNAAGAYWVWTASTMCPQ